MLVASQRQRRNALSFAVTHRVPWRLRSFVTEILVEQEVDGVRETLCHERRYCVACRARIGVRAMQRDHDRGGTPLAFARNAPEGHDTAPHATFLLPVPYKRTQLRAEGLKLLGGSSFVHLGVEGHSLVLSRGVSL